MRPACLYKGLFLRLFVCILVLPALRRQFSGRAQPPTDNDNGQYNDSGPERNDQNVAQNKNENAFTCISNGGEAAAELC